MKWKHYGKDHASTKRFGFEDRSSARPIARVPVVQPVTGNAMLIIDG